MFSETREMEVGLAGWISSGSPGLSLFRGFGGLDRISGRFGRSRSSQNTRLASDDMVSVGRKVTPVTASARLDSTVQYRCHPAPSAAWYTRAGRDLKAGLPPSLDSIALDLMTQQRSLPTMTKPKMLSLFGAAGLLVVTSLAFVANGVLFPDWSAPRKARTRSRRRRSARR